VNLMQNELTKIDRRNFLRAAGIAAGAPIARQIGKPDGLS